MNKTDEIYNFIVQYKKEHDGNSPTTQEIMQGTGLRAKNTVEYHVDKLERQGMIYKEYGLSRGIYVTGGRWEVEG